MIQTPVPGQGCYEHCLFTVCLLEAGLPHPGPVCLTMYFQVFRIFHMQLQELEVTATRPCDTLAQLFFYFGLMVQLALQISSWFSGSWWSSVYTRWCGSSQLPAAAEALCQPLTTFCASLSFIYRMDRRVPAYLRGFCVFVWFRLGCRDTCLGVTQAVPAVQPGWQLPGQVQSIQTETCKIGGVSVHQDKIQRLRSASFSHVCWLRASYGVWTRVGQQ